MMAIVRLLLSLFLFCSVTTPVKAFIEELTFVDRVPFEDRFIEVFEDVHHKGRYYATPLAILDLNTTSCINNIFTGKVQLLFKVVLWSTEAKTEVYDFIKTYVNSSVTFKNVGMVTMTKLRLKWDHSLLPVAQMFRLVEQWYSAENHPSSNVFLIQCASLENCTRLQTAMKSEPNLLTGLELEFTSGRNAKVSRLPLTGSHLLSTDIGRRLLQLRPWPASTEYRYLRPGDITSLVDQTMNARLATLPRGSSYSSGVDRAQVEAQLTALLKKLDISSLLFPDDAWDSVLWSPTYSRPDKLTCYLNNLLSADQSPQYFLLDATRRSASSEGLQEVTTSFFGIHMISTTARSGDVEISGTITTNKIDKQAFLEKMRLYYPHIAFNGRRFIAKPIRLYRADLGALQSEQSVAVKVPDSVIHGIPIRVVSSVEQDDRFGHQAKLMNLSKAYEKLEALQNDLTIAHLNLTATVDTHILEVSTNLATEHRRSNKTAKDLTRVSTELADQNRRLTAAESVNNPTGVVFTRWGRTVCPAGSENVYTGYVVTSRWDWYGGMGMHMCLTDSPRYQSHGGVATFRTPVYRTEYRFTNGFLTTNAGTTSIDGHDMVCTTCRRSGRSTSIVVWGSTECKTGWYKEYDGTILANLAYDSAAHTKLSTDAMCVDIAPEVAPGGRNAEQKSRGYNIYTKCDDAMPCPPFTPSKPLSCAVCSK